MKSLTVIICSLIFSLSLSAQEEAAFSRKGKVLIETGYNIFGGFGGGGSGASILFSDGSTFTSIGIDGGYFISDDFAIKARLGVINDGFFSGSITNFSVGGKYYVIGSIPVELNLGLVGFSGSTAFLGDARVGYGIPLAKNINLEPFLGILFGDGSAGQFGINFAMFL